MTDLNPTRTLALLCLSLSLAGVAQADVAGLIKGCDACHGKDGVSTNAKVPTIAGISAPVQADALYAYKDGAYPCPKSMMCAVSARLSDEQIEEIAEHYAALPFVAATQETNPEKARVGKELHEAHCDRCHTEGGGNAADDASILAGQWKEYLLSVLHDFAEGAREQPKTMQAKFEKLGEAELEALAHYYASQH